ncbi:YrhA family protein [Zobellia sp. 1_MG-2023]|uniref:YrhA family protein n=1 Tax=Zobellia sp. 1_MG-2023 TaxID=3062626 RepID=UPI0026E34D0A|nr:YrhA family protein [Zobellia sp. 1_MG-2023]MDO6819030.1 YrhA family protein [Zobellia sp. 1_MG-2023]
MEIIKELIVEIKNEQKEYGENLQPPAEIENTHKLKLKILESFNFNLSPIYLDILEITNGIDYDGTVLYATETTKIVGYDDRFIDGFFEANEIWHEDEYKKSFLVYAESDMYLFFQSLEDSKFYVVPKDSLDVIVYQTLNSKDFFQKILESFLGRFVE